MGIGVCVCACGGVWLGHPLVTGIYSRTFLKGYHFLLGALYKLSTSSLLIFFLSWFLSLWISLVTVVDCFALWKRRCILLSHIQMSCSSMWPLRCNSSNISLGSGVGGTTQDHQHLTLWPLGKHSLILCFRWPFIIQDESILGSHAERNDTANTGDVCTKEGLKHQWHHCSPIPPILTRLSSSVSCESGLIVRRWEHWCWHARTSRSMSGISRFQECKAKLTHWGWEEKAYVSSAVAWGSWPSSVKAVGTISVLALV